MDATPYGSTANREGLEMSLAPRHPLEPVIERITPHRAAQILAMNISNRHLRKTVITRYVRDMQDGRWEFNGAPIIISETGVLLDGQHRLTALVEAGATLDFAMIYDAPESLRDTVDQGTPRLAGDVLAFAGYATPTGIAAIARIAMAREAGLTNIVGARPSNMAIRDWVDKNPGVIEAAEIYRQSMRQVPANPSVVGAAWYLCSRNDVEWANDFFVRRFIHTEGLTADDPAKALRRRLTEMPKADSSTMKSEQLRYIIHAWNVDRDGRRITKLLAPKGGWTRSNFPEPK